MSGSRFKDLSGIEFGFSYVVDLHEKGGSGKHSKWNCICKCGKAHVKRSSYINNTIKGKEKHFGSCSPQCAQDYLKREEIQKKIIDLQKISKQLEAKWEIKIGIGTLRQAKENKWEFYFSGDKCINGHIDAKATNKRQCLQCRSNESKSSKTKERGKKWRLDNKEHVREQNKIYYQNNRELKIKYSREWGKNNPDKVTASRVKRRSTPEGKLIHNLRNRVNKIMKRIDVVKDSTTLELLGCDALTAKDYIQSQFTEGMTWGNYGDWDVDHIRPCASFDLTKLEEQKIAFNYKNLRPLWSTIESAKKYSIIISYEETNISKGSLYKGERHTFSKKDKA